MKTEKTTFAAGCFWGVEETFRTTPGVISTRVGYTGGSTQDSTYKEVCTDRTGHAEAVEVTFDPKKVSYKKLLKIFWENHDPTQVDQQGPDIGTQYRSGIFYHSEQQKKEAQESKKAEQKGHQDPIATEITKSAAFYPAEEYHQQYLMKHGLNVCH